MRHFHSNSHLKILNHTQYCGKVWKRPDVCQHKLEENWVHSGNIGEGGKAPSQTLSNLTHKPSILWKHISGIVSTFPHSWVWFRIFKWILKWNCWISWRQLSKLLLNKQIPLKGRIFTPNCFANADWKIQELFWISRSFFWLVLRNFIFKGPDINE